MKNIIGNNLVDLQTEEFDDKRYYITPTGEKYPSVTTVLSAHKDKKFLDSWKRRVGEENANKITKYACDVGTDLHARIENFLLNRNDYSPEAKNYSLHSTMMFDVMMDFLKRIDNIHGLELPLYSHTLRMAGRTDCIGEYDSELSIIDFKSSKSEKKTEWIEDYFIQGTIYSLMYEELTGIKIPNVTILMVTYDCQPLIWKRKRKDYFPQVKKLMTEVVPKLLL